MSFAGMDFTQVITAIMAMICVSGTLYVLIMPLFERDGLKSRMKSVALERDEIRMRERARLNNAGKDGRGSLRGSQPTQRMKDLTERFNLQSVLTDKEVKMRLAQAGFRGPGPIYKYALGRVFAPPVLFVVSLFYATAVMGYGFLTGLLVGAAFAGLGYFVPNIYLQNTIEKRQKAIGRAWPDALDLMLICVESGMSIEVAMQKVADEIGVQSADLAEELTLTTAELSYLQDRRIAFENLGNRTGMDNIKNVVMALIQAERYGTPVAKALRAMSDDTRDQRMQEAEKKAASLPPKLTVPMIVFFLPVLFAVIMTPAILQIMDVMGGR
ncbi:type II secretion system protein [Roseibium sp. TrichSKD4]|uniref:type II secretion system F family protein n=1 Tax=Roseibium sp. TrichSKD4 TaxID=744980 RepID=UPI0001E56C02|nr:type II secretion system F family protein [Roseibium sp. TrichSKD4]EFO33162.1 type II secretion system protein [Roseibium sp. TrichSKD4]